MDGTLGNSDQYKHYTINHPLGSIFGFLQEIGDFFTFRKVCRSTIPQDPYVNAILMVGHWPFTIKINPSYVSIWIAYIHVSVMGNINHNHILTIYQPYTNHLVSKCQHIYRIPYIDPMGMCNLLHHWRTVLNDTYEGLEFSHGLNSSWKCSIFSLAAKRSRSKFPNRKKMRLMVNDC